MQLIRIGGGGGFWGDQVTAPIELLSQTELDYLTIDYLSEVTMSILAKQKARDPNMGWATDLVDWLETGGVELLHSTGAKLVTNAGGANAAACAARVLELACEVGWLDCRIALITGDDIVRLIDNVMKGGSSLKNIEDGRTLSEVREDVVSANAYLGAGPIARALYSGADIVITGRVADASLIVGSMLHASGWAENSVKMDLGITTPVHTWAPKEEKHPLDILAGWTIAGHLIECGAQVTGGNSSDWKEIENLANIGYPVAEIDFDGTAYITKPKGTGGLVDCRTVAEQLLYEIGDPSYYITPDVIVDLTNSALNQVGANRVMVKGTKGKMPTNKLKVSATYSDGWFSSGDLIISGSEAFNRAKVCDEILRLRLEDLKSLKINTEFFGAGATLPLGLTHLAIEPNEILIRWAAKSQQRSDLIEFSRSLAPLVLTGPAGVAGYSARSKPRAQLRFFPFLVERTLVESTVRIMMMNTLRLEISELSPALGNVFERLERLANGEPFNQRRRKLARRVLKRLQRPNIRLE